MPSDGGKGIRRTKELVKLRLMTGDTAARRAAAKAERWRNMVGSIEGVDCVVRLRGLKDLEVAETSTKVGT